MLKLLLIVLLLLLVGIGGFLAYAWTRPDTLHVERSTLVHAPADKVFALVEDFHGWMTWSPYERKDPAMKRSFGGSERGKGATYAWEGNGQVGQGSMEIVEATVPGRIVIDLHFLKPFRADNVATFTLRAEDGATRVTWAMDGKAPLIGRAMGLIFDMDKMIGSDFADGLANLKALAER